MREVRAVDPRAIPPALLEGLDPEQQLAVSSVNGPVLVVAGPGSGKTRVLTRRVAAVHAAGIPAGQIAAVTFTNKAASEMRSRIAELTGPAAAGQMTVSTFHSLCARILRRWHHVVDLPSGFTLVDPADVVKLLRTAATELGVTGVDRETRSPSYDIATHAYAAISAAKNAGHVHPKDAGLDRVTTQLWHALQQRMRSAGCVDFDDLLTLTMVLGRHSEARDWLSQRFDRVLVDEFQDTNEVQQQIVSLLAPQGEVFAVGDPDQSIYAFRGATGAVADLFATQFPNHRTIVLGTNYRSTATICAVSASVIARNPAQFRSPMRPAGAGGAPVRLYTAWDEEEEADWVVQQLAAASGSRAILVRANQQTRAFERALVAARVEYSMVGTVRFADRAEVKDVMAWLRLVSNPRDAAAFRRAVGAPRRGVGATTADKVVAYAQANNLGLVDSCVALSRTLGGKPGRALGEFAAVIAAARQAARSGSAESVVATVLSRSGLRDAIASRSSERRDEQLSNVEEMVAAARHVDAQRRAQSDVGPVDPAALLVEHVSLASAGESTSGDSSGDPVVISTIHAAKGREWAHVWVVGCEESVLPHVRSATPEQVAEERRLMFVACSRAEQSLTLTRARSRWSPTMGRGENPPSRFLSDIPAVLLQPVQSARLSELVASPGRVGSTLPPSTGAAPGSLASSGRVMVSSGPTASGPRTAHPAARLAGVAWRVGDRARHATFGTARVVEVVPGSVTVRFDADGAQRSFQPDGIHLRRVTR